MICKVITSAWTSANIIKILLILIDIVRIYNLKIKKLPGGREFFCFFNNCKSVREGEMIHRA
jgi:hypothetical protein